MPRIDPLTGRTGHGGMVLAAYSRKARVHRPADSRDRRVLQVSSGSKHTLSAGDHGYEPWSDLSGLPRYDDRREEHDRRRRIPGWQDPRAATCHTAARRAVDQLYRNSRGHGGVLCSIATTAHADFPAVSHGQNRVMLDLQGGAGILTKCDVCHGVVPAGSGPHGVTPTSVHDEVFAAPDRLRVFPSPTRQGSGCTIMASSSR